LAIAQLREAGGTRHPATGDDYCTNGIKYRRSPHPSGVGQTMETPGTSPPLVWSQNKYAFLCRYAPCSYHYGYFICDLAVKHTAKAVMPRMTQE
jgi:hypothetical protein